MAEATTFEPNRGEPLVCTHCGRISEEHTWRCAECSAALPSGRCGCGAAHVPDALCANHPNTGARLHCK